MMTLSQARLDLRVSSINEIRSLFNCLRALIIFYRLESSLLERRIITAPGRETLLNVLLRTTNTLSQ